MRILHVGNGNEKHRGQRYYDVGRKLQNGLTRNMHHVLFFSDRDVARASNLFGSSRSARGIRAANAHLIALARHFKPEFLLFGHADIISAETVATIRAMFPAMKAAQYNVDPMFMESNIINLHRKLGVVDATFVTTAGPILRKATRPGHRAAFMPNPTDSSIETHRAHTHSDQPYDLFYAVRATTTTGDLRGNYRVEMPRYLRAEIPELACHFHGFDGAAEIFGAPFYEAMGRCRMGLNLSHMQTTKGEIRAATAEESYFYSSDRISQYMGNGLLIFTHASTDLPTLYGEDALVTFDTREELAEKIRYYRTHDDARQRIAGNGWQAAHTRFNERLVAQYIVEATLGEGFSQNYAWPTEFF